MVDQGPYSGANIRPVLSHDIFALQRTGGISRYIAETHDALLRMQVPSVILAPLHKSDLLNKTDRVVGVRIPHSLQIKGTNWLAMKSGRIAEGATLALLTRMYSGVVLHKTYYAAAGPPRGVATVITVHDMTHELHPDAFAAVVSARKRMWCERADAVIAVSHYTKTLLAKFVDVDMDRVFVCHHGVTKVTPDQATLEVLSDGQPFMLYVGKRGGYKNFHRLAVAYAQSSAVSEGVAFVAFGGGAPTKSELFALKELGIGHLVRFVGGNDAVLAAHYATALALLYPSLDEGFGFPPLEAMQHACPVVAARAGAIPEIVQGAALLVDPMDESAMASSIDRVVSDSALRSRLSERGVARSASFSWDRAAKATLAAYAAALAHAGSRL